MGWISVFDALPAFGVDVLVYDESAKAIRVLWINSVGDWLDGVHLVNPDGITHWQQLPEPPKDD